VELSGGQFLPPVQKLVATLIFAKGENAYQVLPLQPKKFPSLVAWNIFCL